MEQTTGWCAANGIPKWDIPDVVSALKIYQDRDLVKQLLDGGILAIDLIVSLQLMIGQSKQKRGLLNKDKAKIFSLYE